jgi:hypothetical protein
MNRILQNSRYFREIGVVVTLFFGLVFFLVAAGRLGEAAARNT